MLPNCRLYNNPTVITTAWQIQKQTHRSAAQDREPRNDPMNLGSNPPMTKKTKKKTKQTKWLTGGRGKGKDKIGVQN